VTGSTVSFAFVAGTVATVNPCGFALPAAELTSRAMWTPERRRSLKKPRRSL
jgi:hypothetical protein